jgi:hypothetical protein
MNTDEIFEKAEALCVLAAQEPDQYSDEFTLWNKEAQKLEHQGWKIMTGQTQHDKIMKHLIKAGSITVREAMVEYSVSSLPKRIQELRELGNEIISNIKFHPITGQKYTRYTL